MLTKNLINVLILFFILLLLYQIFLAEFTVIEGLDNQGQYQPYNTNDPNNVLILAQQNAGNIQVLKQQLDGLMSLKEEVLDISGNVAILQTQVNGIAGAHQQYASNMTKNPPPTITGT
jgi:hypothetical protein